MQGRMWNVSEKHVEKKEVTSQTSPGSISESLCPHVTHSLVTLGRGPGGKAGSMGLL